MFDFCCRKTSDVRVSCSPSLVTSSRKSTRERLPKIDLTQHCRRELEKLKTEKKKRESKTEKDSKTRKKPIHGRALSEGARERGVGSRERGDSGGRILSGRQYDGFRGLVAPKHFQENFNNLTFRLVERIKPYVGSS